MKFKFSIDLKYLNNALILPHHPMHTVEEVKPQMAGATVFSVLKRKPHIKQDEASSLRTTFVSPFGRYKFLRIPFDINTASKVFQRVMEQIFAGYP